MADKSKVNSFFKGSVRSHYDDLHVQMSRIIPEIPWMLEGGPFVRFALRPPRSPFRPTPTSSKGFLILLSFFTCLWSTLTFCNGLSGQGRVGTVKPLRTRCHWTCRTQDDATPSLSRTTSFRGPPGQKEQLVSSGVCSRGTGEVTEESGRPRRDCSETGKRTVK